MRCPLHPLNIQTDSYSNISETENHMMHKLTSKENIEILKDDIENMKRLVRGSEDEMNQSIEELSWRILKRSQHTLGEINDIKQYACAVLSKENKKMKDEKIDLENRVGTVNEKIGLVGSLLMARTDDEFLTLCQHELRNIERTHNAKRTKI